ncbi:MAG: diguanylate cyclase [Solirubrobacteraceae bacterium]
MIGFSLRRAAAVLAIPVVLIACAVFATATIERDSALHAGQQEEAGQRLLTGMLDQETGARGFFQTGQSEFLQPWYQGRSEFLSALAQERVLSAGDTSLLQALDQQAGLATGWQSTIAGEITRLQDTGRHPSLTGDALGKAIMDSFRQVNTVFLAQVASRRDRALSQATSLAVGVAAGLCVLLVLAGIAIVRRASRHESEQLDRRQELRELLQVAESEEESQLLLIHHVQRSVPGAGAAVLNRNSSDDRLECRIDKGGDGGPLADLVSDELQPRSCLAVRLSRPYRQSRGEELLMRCEACGKVAGDVLCEPLLVGGEVIGSVLVARARAIGEQEVAAVHQSVLLAAPILANQRNLAVAERRAASDVLTGLPNRRAAEETLKRMIAHAGRTITPLSAILLDLDHFKQVNDIHGHDRGDSALAAIGQVLAAGVRASDFASRYGGEEFLLLLPDTDRGGAVEVAEKLRHAIEQTEVQDVGSITASFGIATLPDDAGEPDQLIRKADRALYAAKARGRNRVEVAAPSGGQGLTGPDLNESPPQF